MSNKTLWMGLTLAIFNSIAGGEEELRFNADIRPILSEYCFSCHGPDGAGRKADLRLDEAAGALESGAVVPGKAEESELIRRIVSRDEDLVMPPPDTGKKLSQKHKEILRRWIQQGAKWEQHWAFVAPVRPRVPVVAPSGWARNPVDHFVYARLKRLQLQPAQEADRYTLARRAALDVTGLPPSEAALQRFIGAPIPSATMNRWPYLLQFSPPSAILNASWLLERRMPISDLTA